MSNTTEYYANKANLTPVINKIEGKLNNRYTKEEVDDLLEEHSGGHTIENASGTALTQRDTLQFKGGLSVSDDSTNEVTVVTDTVPEIEWSVWNAMTPQEQEAIPNALILNAPDSGGGSGIEWITKEEWDAMTPEQQSNGTYGVQGLGEVSKIVDISSNITFHPSLSNTHAKCYRYGKVVSFEIYFHVTTAISGVWQNLVDGFPTPLAQVIMVNVSNMVNERTTVNSLFSLANNSNHIENGKPLSAGDDVWLSGTYLTND